MTVEALEKRLEEIRRHRLTLEKKLDKLTAMLAAHKKARKDLNEPQEPSSWLILVAFVAVALVVALLIKN
ncbi:MAG: hypothetical protein DDT29_02508 [Dehalococcoidia bacterium]|nr:hypothetical protein [Bacillota bacterium]